MALDAAALGLPEPVEGLPVDDAWHVAQTAWPGSSTSEVFVLASAAWQLRHVTIRCGV